MSVYCIVPFYYAFLAIVTGSENIKVINVQQLDETKSETSPIAINGNLVPAALAVHVLSYSGFPFYFQNNVGRRNCLALSLFLFDLEVMGCGHLTSSVSLSGEL